MNNGLKSKDCIYMIDCLQRHYTKISVLNLAKNKLGLIGAKHLASCLKQMKMLSNLNLSGNEIGNIGITEIVNNSKTHLMLQVLDLSGNSICKSSQSNECAEAIFEFLN